MKKIIVKKSHCCLVFLTVLFFLATPVMATQKAELWLWKFDEFLSGLCGWCGDFVTSRKEKIDPVCLTFRFMIKMAIMRLV